MTDQPADLVLEHLRAIRAKGDSIEARMSEGFNAVNERLGLLEVTLARQRREAATDAEFLAPHMRSLERLEARMQAV